VKFKTTSRYSKHEASREIYFKRLLLYTNRTYYNYVTMEEKTQSYFKKIEYFSG